MFLMNNKRKLAELMEREEQKTDLYSKTDCSLKRWKTVDHC